MRDGLTGHWSASVTWGLSGFEGARMVLVQKFFEELRQVVPD